jgi:hypothetical protein
VIIGLRLWPDRDRQIKHLAAGRGFGEGQGGMAVVPSSRRCFLAGATALGAGLVAPWRSAATEPSAARSLIPRKVLFGNPDVSWARLTHDGAHLTYVAPLDGVRNPVSGRRGGGTTGDAGPASDNIPSTGPLSRLL